MLRQAGMKFEDVVPDWPAWKSESPSGGLPVLESSDGTRMGQTCSIARFIGRINGWQPTNPKQAAMSDIFLEDFNDFLFMPLSNPLITPEGPDRDAMIKKVFDEVLPKWMPIIEKAVGTRTKYMVRDELSTCDFFYGRLYVDFFSTNARSIYCKEKWLEWLAKCPNFEAYGKRFDKECKKAI